MANRGHPVQNRRLWAIDPDPNNDDLIKVKMRLMDWKHIKAVLEHRVKYIYDDFALEILEQIKKNNKYLL